ncbi:MAG: hypothetical protein ACJBCI_00010 [Candidatus Tisiphia sp.]
MRLLLDIHTLIWALSETEKLPPKLPMTKITNYLPMTITIFVGVVSLWELQIKDQ